MFTGLVSDIGEVIGRTGQGEGIRFRIACGYAADSIAIGASIACSGPCLTVVDRGAAHGRAWFDVEVSPETLDRTTARDWAIGRRLNLERSLRIGDELGGHLVTGHVDATITVRDRRVAGDYTAFAFDLPRDIAPFVAEKGSVALDGTSLTVNAVDAGTFEVMLIPHTLAVTTWGAISAGDVVNVEVDLMARYAARLAATGRASLSGGAR